MTTTPSTQSQTRIEHKIVVPAHIPTVALLGSRGLVLRAVEEGFPGVDVHARGNEIAVNGPAGDVALVTQLLDELIEVVEAGTQLTPEVVKRSVAMLSDASASRPAEVLTFNILSSRGRTIRPKTVGQKAYVDAIDTNTITFGIGPAGTGKTYLAMAKAVQALQAKQVNRIILDAPRCRGGGAPRVPARHALREDRPLPSPAVRRAARHDRPAVRKAMEAGTIEVAPLAYMRVGASRHSFVVLDEAQNASTDASDEDVPDPPWLTPRWSLPAMPPRWTCPAAPPRASASSRTSCWAWTTSSSAGAMPPLRGTGW